MGPIRARAGGFAWYKAGWQWFLTNPFAWIVLIMTYFVILIGLQLIPIAGPLIGAVAWPALSAGLLYAAQKSSQNKAINPNDLFAAFKYCDNKSGLIHLGFLSLVVALLTGFAIASFGGVSLMEAIQGTDPATMEPEQVELITSQLPTLMTIIGISSAITASLFLFAVPLVAFENYGAIPAIKTSLAATVINVFPLTVFGVLYIVFAMLASIPFMLGFLVLIPVSICAWYGSYTDIFPPASAKSETTE